MRYRTRQPPNPRFLNALNAYEGEEMWDDPTWALRKTNKPCIKNTVKVSSDKPCLFTYHWFDSWSGNWYGPVTSANLPTSLNGPSGFYGYEGVGDFPPQPEPNSGFIWDEIKKYGKSDVNVGVFLGELKETVAMFHNPWKAAVAISKGKIPKWIRSLPDAVNFVSSNYLGYRYGWKPFLSDVRGFTRLSQRLDQRAEADAKRKPTVLKASRTKSESSSRCDTWSYTPGPAYLVQWNNSCTSETTTCEYCEVVSNPAVAAMSVAAKFSDFYHLNDIASIAWELTPYSFIVDWFLPIGDLIEDNLGAPSSIIAASSPGCWRRTKQIVEVSNEGRSNELYKVNITFGYKVERIAFTRDNLASFPPKPSEINGYQKLDLALIAGQTLGKLFGKSFRR